MTDREPMEAPFQTIDLAPTMDDAALLRATRATLRRGDGPVLFRGLLDRPLDDAESFAAWLATLDGSRSLLCLAASGKVGPRGLALALACDLAFAGPDVGASPEWRATLGLATLASRRLGPLGARILLLRADDPLRCLSDLGQLVFDPSPEAAMTDALRKIGGPRAAAAMRRNLRAAAELPFAEGCSFEAWSYKLGRGEPQ